MPKRKIVVVGGGFAGTSAIRYFSKHRSSWAGIFEIVLIDAKENFEFLPMLPDVIRGRIDPGTLRFRFDRFCRKAGVTFINANVNKLDTKSKRVYFSDKVIDYDHILLSSGVKTYFHGNREFENVCYTLDSVKDAVFIREEILLRISSMKAVNLLIIGGGYTGVEVAASAALLLERFKARHSVTIAEKSDSVLAASPVWVRESVRRELEKAKIKILAGESLEGFKDGMALLSSGRTINDVMCVWTAGVRAPEFLDDLSADKINTRLNVDRGLNSVNKSCGGEVFAAGDNAYFFDGNSGSAVRMAVNAAIVQGVKAAENILRNIKDKRISIYRPLDPGYVVPLSRGRAPGVVFERSTTAYRLFSSLFYVYLPRAIFRKNQYIERSLTKKEVMMNNDRSVDMALLVLRVAVGIIMAAHRAQKIFGVFDGSGIIAFSEMLKGMGFAYPLVWAWIAGASELIFGVFLVLGIIPRISSVIIAVIMGVAIVKVHGSNGFFMMKGGFEYQFLILASSVALIMSGAGKISIFNKL